MMEFKRRLTEGKARREFPRVLLTGSTGFVGQGLLLRLNELQYGPVTAMIRKKKGVEPRDRLIRMVRRWPIPKRRPELISVIPKDIEHLKQEDIPTYVEVVVHSAANVKFSQSARGALQANCEATKKVLSMALKLPHLKVFIYVSTAYVSTKQEAEARKLREKAHGDVPKSQKFANTYSYSKRYAEYEVIKMWKKSKIKASLIIIRPSIIGNSEKYLGWGTSLNHLNAVYMYHRKGKVSSLVGNSNGFTNVIPIEYVSETIIAAIEHFSKNPQEVEIINCVASNRFMNNKRFTDFLSTMGVKVKWRKAADWTSGLINQKISEVFGPFLLRNWNFDRRNLYKLQHASGRHLIIDESSFDIETYWKDCYFFVNRGRTISRVRTDVKTRRRKTSSRYCARRQSRVKSLDQKGVPNPPNTTVEKEVKGVHNPPKTLEENTKSDDDKVLPNPPNSFDDSPKSGDLLSGLISLNIPQHGLASFLGSDFEKKEETKANATNLSEEEHPLPHLDIKFEKREIEEGGTQPEQMEIEEDEEDEDLSDGTEGSEESQEEAEDIPDHKEENIKEVMVDESISNIIALPNPDFKTGSDTERFQKSYIQPDTTTNSARTSHGTLEPLKIQDSPKQIHVKASFRSQFSASVTRLAQASSRSHLIKDTSSVRASRPTSPTPGTSITRLGRGLWGVGATSRTGSAVSSPLVTPVLGPLPAPTVRESESRDKPSGGSKPSNRISKHVSDSDQDNQVDNHKMLADKSYSTKPSHNIYDLDVTSI